MQSLEVEGCVRGKVHSSKKTILSNPFIKSRKIGRKYLNKKHKTESKNGMSMFASRTGGWFYYITLGLMLCLYII